MVEDVARYLKYGRKTVAADLGSVVLEEEQVATGSWRVERWRLGKKWVKGYWVKEK